MRATGGGGGGDGCPDLLSVISAPAIGSGHDHGLYDNLCDVWPQGRGLAHQLQLDRAVSARHHSSPLPLPSPTPCKYDEEEKTPELRTEKLFKMLKVKGDKISFKDFLKGCKKHKSIRDTLNVLTALM